MRKSEIDGRLEVDLIEERPKMGLIMFITGVSIKSV